MQQQNLFVKIGVLAFAIVLMGTLVAYRSGAFEITEADSLIQTDTNIPEKKDSLPPQFIYSSKSMSPVFEAKQKKEIPVTDSVEPNFAPSSKSGRVFHKEDIIAPSSKSGVVFKPEDVKADSTKPKKEKKKKTRKPRMSSSKSGAVF